MFWNAKGGRIHIEDTDMDYITFGQGDDVLVMIPGLGDGLTTVKGMALPLAYTYRMYAKDYSVYIFSRKNHLEKSHSIWQSTIPNLSTGSCSPSRCQDPMRRSGMSSTAGSGLPGRAITEHS